MQVPLLDPNQRARLADPERLRALEQTRLLDSRAEEAFDRATRLAADFLHAPLALVNLVDDRRQFTKSCVGPPEWPMARETPLSDSLCKWAVIEAMPVRIGNARADARARDSSMVEQGGLQSYLGIPLSTHDGHVLGTLCVADFTPRRWADREVTVLADLAAGVVTEIELRRELAQRAELERMKDEFIAMVSHELRTPLTSIHGSLRLVASGRLSDELPPQAQRLVEIASQNSERLVRLINDVLDLERLQPDRLELSRQTVEVPRLVEAALDMVRGMAERSEVALEAAVPGDLTVFADPDRLLQVLINLVANATKFSPPGSVVRVMAERRGAEVLFQVRDRGRGIPADKLESIFEAFRQADSSDARQKGGSGLGLAIARRIVRGHGGRIWVASQVERGSTFFFTVPAEEDTGETPVGTRA